jgi:flavin reductase (DIM6/NTAB) family NADH-FMN oxidoreductase RutF
MASPAGNNPRADPEIARLFRRAASFIPTGVAILSSGDITMIVSSLQCISFDPPMLSVALAKDSIKGEAISDSGRFRARLLRHGEEKLCRGERLPSTPALLEVQCLISAIYAAGDHHLVLATVEQLSTSQGYPIVYWRRGLHAFQPRYPFLSSPAAFQKFVAAWEAGTLPKSEWTHAAHIAVGASYAVRFGRTAFERIKVGIVNYNQAVGTENTSNSGYHETLTRFWSMLLAQAVGAFSDPWEAACKAVEEFGEERDLHYLFYSFDVVRSVGARQTWVPPDLEGPYAFC